MIPLNSAMKLQVVTCLQYRAVAACEFSPGLEDRWARFVGPLHSLQLKVVPFALIQIQRKFYEQHLVCVAFFFLCRVLPTLASYEEAENSMSISVAAKATWNERKNPTPINLRYCQGMEFQGA